MKNNTAGKYFIALFSIIISNAAWAGSGKPVNDCAVKNSVAFRHLMDTVPSSIKPGTVKNEPAEKAVATTIKKVPKVRRQSIPQAVPVQVRVQPIKVIKPKLLKPVIKIF